MPEFLVETYVARGERHSAEQYAAQAARAADTLTRRGDPVRCLRTIVVPEDETCLLLFEAPSAAVVQEALDTAGLRAEHISAATSVAAPS
jgi:hypothetical protein